jgi:hypothetical protein
MSSAYSSGMSEKAYLHVLDGRLRVKVPEVRRSHEKAAQIEALLLGTAGIWEASANPHTGNVLILFDSEKVDHHRIIAILREHSRLELPARRDSGHTQHIADTLMKSAVQLALERMLLALV